MTDQEPPVAPPPVRRTVHFSGRVQGVGFRFTTQHIAEQFDVTGLVRNLSDGRVEIVAEGQVVEIDRFLQAIHDNIGGHITGSTSTIAPHTGEFQRFEIAY